MDFENKLIKYIGKNTYLYPEFPTPFGMKKMIYADYTASGRHFKQIEDYITNNIYPYYANTHSNAFCGRLMNSYIKQSRNNIKEAINANDSDNIIFTGNGCSGAVSHLVHVLDIKNKSLGETVIFVTEFEHNSNYLPWKHCNTKLEIVKTLDNGLINIEYLGQMLEKYKEIKTKIISFSAGSNINGIIQDISKISILGHSYNCIVIYDFAAICPYVDINMHRDDAKGDYIDVLMLSPHKMLGGPGTPGLLVANNKIFKNNCPFFPSGGTVRFVSTEKSIYSENIETKESGGTPNIIGCIKTGMVFKLKQALMKFITEQEKIINKLVKKRLLNVNNLDILFPNCNNDTSIKQIPIYPIVIKGLHYNFVVVLLNDLFGIQTRGGISCSGIYAEKLLNISKKYENDIVDMIIDNKGIPDTYGWCRITFHYSMSIEIINYIIDCVIFISKYGKLFSKLYVYNAADNIWKYNDGSDILDGYRLNDFITNKNYTHGGQNVTNDDFKKNLIVAYYIKDKLKNLRKTL